MEEDRDVEEAVEKYCADLPREAGQPICGDTNEEAPIMCECACIGPDGRWLLSNFAVSALMYWHIAYFALCSWWDTKDNDGPFCHGGYGTVALWFTLVGTMGLYFMEAYLSSFRSYCLTQMAESEVVEKVAAIRRSPPVVQFHAICKKQERSSSGKGTHTVTVADERSSFIFDRWEDSSDPAHLLKSQLSDNACTAGMRVRLRKYYRCADEATTWSHIRKYGEFCQKYRFIGTRREFYHELTIDGFEPFFIATSGGDAACGVSVTYYWIFHALLIGYLYRAYLLVVTDTVDYTIIKTISCTSAPDWATNEPSSAQPPPQYAEAEVGGEVGDVSVVVAA